MIDDNSLDIEKNNEEPQKIEVVNGNGDLNISPVYEHLEVEKPKPKENRPIVVPEVKDDTSIKKKKENKEAD